MKIDAIKNNSSSSPYFKGKNVKLPPAPDTKAITEVFHTDKINSPVFKLPVDYVFELSRSRFYKPNIFIGSGLYDGTYADRCSCNPTCLEILKKAGIKTVIDLDYIGGKYKELVENAGFKYYGYSVHENLVSNNYRNKEKKDNLIDFVKEMQKDNIYMSGYTVGTRDSAAIINAMVNLNFDGRVRLSRDFIEVVDYTESFVKKMYDLMTTEDKKSIGWTPEFEKQFKEKWL